MKVYKKQILIGSQDVNFTFDKNSKNNEFKKWLSFALNNFNNNATNNPQQQLSNKTHVNGKDGKRGSLSGGSLLNFSEFLKIHIVITKINKDLTSNFNNVPKAKEIQDYINTIKNLEEEIKLESNLNGNLEISIQEKLNNDNNHNNINNNIVENNAEYIHIQENEELLNDLNENFENVEKEINTNLDFNKEINEDLNLNLENNNALDNNDLIFIKENLVENKNSQNNKKNNLVKGKKAKNILLKQHHNSVNNTEENNNENNNIAKLRDSAKSNF